MTPAPRTNSYTGSDLLPACGGEGTMNPHHHGGSGIVVGVVALWFVIFPLFPSLLPSSMVVAAATDLKPRCGDCWCIVDQENVAVNGTDGGGGEVGECPTNQQGITDTFPPDIYQLYETFELTNPDAPYLTLQSSDGGDCFPFADTFGPMEDYQGSSLPQCVLPEGTETTVCAYLYEESDDPTQCLNRKYQVLNYDSAGAAQGAGAVVTHVGPCGVCSDAHDLWARMASIDDFEVDTLLCGASYFLNPDKDNRFDDLVACAMEEAGLGLQCALLWAHYGATLLNQCSSECNAGTTEATNGPAPECALADCPACPSSWNANFWSLGGRTLEGSGISEGTAKSCSSFVRIEHDPCVGTSAEGTTVAPSIAAITPTGSGSRSSSRRGGKDDAWIFVGIVMASFLLTACTAVPFDDY